MVQPPKQINALGFTSALGGFLKFIFYLCSFIAVFVIFLWVYIDHVFNATHTNQKREVTIARGSGFIPSLEMLHKSKLLPHPWITLGYYFFHDHEALVQAGTYSFNHQSPAEIIEMLRKGDVKSYKLTFPEGLTVHAIVEKLNAIPDMIGTITELPKEGSLMPDTYSYSYGMNRKIVLDHMNKRMDEYLQKKWEARTNKYLKKPEQILTLASIIEKESAHGDELAHISGVYMNRLKIRMHLQSDPTVIYALTNGQKNFNRAVTFQDLKIQSSFNTYRNYGLPPTPICCPGKEAIDAALNPIKTRDKFFVKIGKTHKFSETFSEHKRNIQIKKNIEKEGIEKK